MAKETTYEEIARDLKNRIYKPVYYLMGEESYYIDRISEYIAQTVLNENEKEFNQTILYGADTDIATIINAAKRYPMMSKYQVVIVKEAQGVKNIDELSYYLQKPLESTILVLCHKHGVLDRRKKLAAEIEKVGVLFESKKIKDTQLAGFITSYLKRKSIVRNNFSLTTTSASNLLLRIAICSFICLSSIVSIYSSIPIYFLVVRHFFLILL